MFPPDPKDPKEPGYWGVGAPNFNASWPYFVLVPSSGMTSFVCVCVCCQEVNSGCFLQPPSAVLCAFVYHETYVFSLKLGGLYFREITV